MTWQSGNFNLSVLESIHPCGFAADGGAIFGIYLAHGFGAEGVRQ